MKFSKKIPVTILLKYLQMNYMSKWLAVFLFNIMVWDATAQGFLRASGEKIVDAQGENILFRGIGLGGWMLQEGYMLGVYKDGQQHKIRQAVEFLIGKDSTDLFYSAWLNNHTTRADIDSLKAWGFNSVRLPMHYNLYTLAVEAEPQAGKNTWLARGFALTDSLLAWCKANQMYLILDLHAAPGGQGNDLNISDRDAAKPSLWQSDANRAKTIALWRKIAERYAHEPWIAGYDLINEPNWGFQDPENDKNGLKETGNEPLRELLKDITHAIREVDKNHIIIIEGNGWGNNYHGIFPLWDDNMVVSFHKYWNYNDVDAIRQILETRTKYNVPVWLGETGENSNVWYTQAIALLEGHNIGWAWWPLKKLGNNNPLQIPTNNQYERILDYWRGNASQPSASDAFHGVMQLARASNLQNNTIHYDVIDAMIRQPHSLATKPFKQHIAKPGLMVKAVDYDLGRNGSAYYDLDTADYHISDGSTGGNKGRQYRNDGVDIRQDSVSGSYVVFDIKDGEWLQYTLYADRKSRYRLKLKIRDRNAGGEIAIVINGVRVDSLAVKPGSAADVWQTKPVTFSPGENKLRVIMLLGGFEFQGFELQRE